MDETSQRARNRPAALLVLGLLAGGCAGPAPGPAGEAGGQAGAAASAPVSGHAEAHASGSVPPCTEISPHCGATPTPAFDGAGRLWVAFERQGQAYVAFSDDAGGTFSAPVAVNREPEAIETNGENRPKVAPGPGGMVYVSWTKKLEGRFHGDIRFSRSLDGGKSFEEPRTVNDDGLATGHRFESLHVGPAGEVTVVWIDKRDLEAARSRGEDYAGAAIYSATSTDRGATFDANRRLAHHACECCRIALADGPGGGTAVLWRHVFDGGIRDHAFAVVGPPAARPLQRATADGWKIDGCPHHGPALAAAAEGGYHLAWFTSLEGEPAALYGRFDPRGGLRHRSVLAHSPVAHPSVVEAGGRLLFAWKEMEGESTRVQVRESADGGVSWGEPETVASTAGASDHPLLLAGRGRPYLSWHTAAEGLRVLALDQLPVAGTGE